MRPIFCGNFEYDARQSELERLFRRYGRVEKVDMKSGFAFVYMEDERDGEDAIRGLDQIEFGRKGRRLRVEWAKQERGIRRPGGGSKRSANLRPSKTLFVINFDQYNTRTRDLERHFDPYGKVANVRIRKNFAFIQFETQDDATRALEATHLSKLMDRLISVEYAVRDDDERGNGYSADRIRDRSPARRGYERGRSPSPYRRERGSPDYGHGPSQSPIVRRRASPDYGRRSSPSPYRRERDNSDYGRGPSPIPQGRERDNSRDGRGLSSSPRRRDGHNPRRTDGHGLTPSPRRGDVRGRSPSPHRRDVRARSPGAHRGNVHANSRSPRGKEDGSDISLSPQRNDGRVPSPSPPRKNSGRRSPDSPGEEDPGYSPRRGDGASPDYARHASPNSKVEVRGSPNYEDQSPVPEGDRSRSPPQAFD